MQIIFIYIDISRILIKVHEFAFDINVHLVKEKNMHLILSEFEKINNFTTIHYIMNLTLDMLFP